MVCDIPPEMAAALVSHLILLSVQFSSVKLLPTPMQIQKDKKGPRFPRHIAPTRKWARSSCISFSRESLLYTPRLPPPKLQLQGELRANSVRTTRELRARTHPRTTRRARLISYPKLVRRAQKYISLMARGSTGFAPPHSNIALRWAPQRRPTA